MPEGYPWSTRWLSRMTGGQELTANRGVIFWLGAKQAIMLLILAAMVCMVPTFVVTAEVERYVVPMRIGVLVAVVLAVWRPIA